MINIRKQLKFTGSYAGGIDRCELKDKNYTLTQPDEYVDADFYIAEEWADNFRLTLIDTGVKIHVSLDWDNHDVLANGQNRFGEGYCQFNTSNVISARDAASAFRSLADKTSWLTKDDQLTFYETLLDLLTEYLDEVADAEN